MSTSGNSGSSESRASFATRTEADAFGEILVEDTRYWGAQTQRSLLNFPIGGNESRMPIEVIKGMHRLFELNVQLLQENAASESSVSSKTDHDPGVCCVRQRRVRNPGIFAAL